MSWQTKVAKTTPAWISHTITTPSQARFPFHPDHFLNSTHCVLSGKVALASSGMHASFAIWSGLNHIMIMTKDHIHHAAEPYACSGMIISNTYSAQSIERSWMIMSYMSVKRLKDSDVAQSLIAQAYLDNSRAQLHVMRKMLRNATSLTAGNINIILRV